MKNIRPRPISIRFGRLNRVLGFFLRLDRKRTAILFVLVCVVLFSWVLVKSYNEWEGKEAGYPQLPEEFVHFRVTVLSVDEVNRFAQVKSQVISKWNAKDDSVNLLRLRGIEPHVVIGSVVPPGGRMTTSVPLSVFSSQPRGGHITLSDADVTLSLPQSVITSLQHTAPTKEPSARLSAYPSKATLYFGPLLMRDIAEDFAVSGVAGFANLTPPASEPTPGPEYTTEVPSARSSEIEVDGDPWVYPFDRYILIGQISCNVFASLDGNEFVSFDVMQTDIDLRSPDFVQKYLSFDDLRRLHRDLPHQLGVLVKKAKTGEMIQDNADAVFHYLDRAKQVREYLFAVELMRPFFLRFFSVFLLVVALASITYYVFKSSVKEFALQAVGYFVGLWAVRQILVSNGPKTSTVIDYAVFTLYFCLIVALVGKAIYTGKTGQPEK